MSNFTYIGGDGHMKKVGKEAKATVRYKHVQMHLKCTSKMLFLLYASHKIRKKVILL